MQTATIFLLYNNDSKTLSSGNLRVFLCFLQGIEVRAQGQEKNRKIVRVGWYQSDMFQEGISDDQMKKGYCYDYLQKVSDYTYWEYKYVYGNWTELFRML